MIDEKSLYNGLFLGVDGCRGGWIVSAIDHGELHHKRFDTICEVVESYPDFDAFLIDMPIGLKSKADQLRPDELARKELGQRSSTVFPVPSRQAVYAGTGEEQRLTNIRVLGKSLAAQSIGIIPKIREIDEFLQSCPEYKNRILESHPELAFARLKGAVLLSRKREYEGLIERKSVLERYLPGLSLSYIWDKAKELKCKPDDLMDAICLAITAAFSSAGLCETIPQGPVRDETGLLMGMTIPRKSPDSVAPINTGSAEGLSPQSGCCSGIAEHPNRRDPEQLKIEDGREGMDTKTTIQDLKDAVRDMCLFRGWGGEKAIQDPQRMVMAMTVELGELTEHFAWLSQSEMNRLLSGEMPARRDHIAEELADVMIYAFQLARALDVDLSEAMLKKIEIVKGRRDNPDLGRSHPHVDSDQ